MKEVHTVAKMGRPKAESPKKKNVSFRLTEEEYQKLSEYAAKHELTTTQTIQKGCTYTLIQIHLEKEDIHIPRIWLS